MKEKPSMNYDQKKVLKKRAKRFAMTLLCVLPLLYILGYFVLEKYVSDAVEIFIYVVLMGLAVFIVELIANKREAKQKKLPSKKDVFK